MKISNKLIYETYYKGFLDELDNKWENTYIKTILIKAYSIGRIDAKLGDDTNSIDNRTKNEIINYIKNI